MIQGAKISLRAIEEADVDSYHAWINDDETNQWRGLHHPASKEDAAEWINTRRSKTKETLNLSVSTKEGTHIGFVGLQGICARSRRAEVWIYIGSKAHWGQGYGEDTIRTLCRYAFEEMNLFRIWLECNPEFAPVVGCYENVGFKKEGNLRKAYYRNGAFHDTCIMGLLRDEFVESKEPGLK